MNTPLNIIVACGGTGGHTFPGLAVAAELRSRGHNVTVWKSGRSIEASVMKRWDGNTFSTGARTLSPRNLLANLFSFLRCMREIKRFKPAVLVAMGSYSSLAPVACARLRGVPVVLHEANTVPGRAVEFLSRWAHVVAISFQMTAGFLKHCRTALAGLPVRAEIFNRPPLEEVPRGSFCVFVTGGSQGARRVNELASQALVIVKQDLERRGSPKKLFVIHQCGRHDENMVMQRYADARIPSRVTAFEHEMGSAFASASLVVARAGASTCFELAALGKPAFFIPLPSAVRNHQHFNAQAFVQNSAADEGIQDALAPRALANYILRKIDNPDSLESMSKAMLAMSVPDAAARVADIAESAARSSSTPAESAQP